MYDMYTHIILVFHKFMFIVLFSFLIPLNILTSLIFFEMFLFIIHHKKYGNDTKDTLMFWIWMKNQQVAQKDMIAQLGSHKKKNYNG